MIASLAEGLTGDAALLVSPADLATALGSGDVPVLGTPRVVALAEAATVAAVAEHLEPGRTTVGIRVDITHRRPSYAGARVSAHARLADVTGARLRFDVEVRDGGEIVASGVVERAIVDRSRFAGGRVAGGHAAGGDVPGGQ